MNNKELKINLVKARESLQLTQEEMARKIGISRQAYVNLEHGKTHLLNKHLPIIARECGMSIDKLCLGYDPVPNPKALLSELKEKTDMLAYSEREKERLRSKMEDMERILKSQKEHIESLKDIQIFLTKQLDRK